MRTPYQKLIRRTTTTLVIVSLIAVSSLFTTAAIMGLQSGVHEANTANHSAGYKAPSGDITLGTNGYAGWQMACDYALGSDPGWNEALKAYGDQKYMQCANGLVYVAVGTSPSEHHFSPDDTAVNKKYCGKNEVATFNYDNPLTKENEEGTFNSCMSW